MRDPLAAQPDLGVGLGAGLDLDLLVAVDGRDLESRPEGRLGDGDRGFVVQLRAVPLQRGMGRDVDGDIQRSGRPATRPDLALVGQPDLVALVDAGRDRHPEAALALRPTVAFARLARGLDDLALTPAARTGLDVDHLAEHRLADAADLAAALALRARRGLRVGLGTGAGTGLAAPQDPELDLLVGASDRLLEGDPQVVAQIRARLRPAPTGRTAGRPAEERIEDVAEAAEPLEPRARAAGAALDSGPSEHVVALTPLGIREDLVGLAGFLEPTRRLRILVHVGMPLLGELSEGALDLRIACAAIETEHLVQVAFRGCHLSPKSTRGEPEPRRAPRPER
jgi:hypothetical protein